MKMSQEIAKNLKKIANLVKNGGNVGGEWGGRDTLYVEEWGRILWESRKN